jgi:hypothetical protein
MGKRYVIFIFYRFYMCLACFGFRLVDAAIWAHDYSSRHGAVMIEQSDDDYRL